MTKVAKLPTGNTLKYADTAIKNAKAPAAGQLDYKIEGRPGLRLRVAASGLKTWTHLYRHRGNLRRAMIGTYPGISLAQADKRWSDARDAIRAGADPYPTRDERKERARLEHVAAEREKANSFRAVVEAYLADKREGGGAEIKSKKLVERRLENYAMPEFGDRPIGEITRADVRDLLRDMVNGEAPVAANRLLTNLKRVFAWAVENDKIETSPVAVMKKPVKEQSRDRVLTDAELAEIWAACDRLATAHAAVVRTMILTGARRTEAGGMKRSELRGEEWHLPAERSKNGRSHLVPLAPLARDVLGSAPTFDRCEYVFSTDGENPVSGWSKVKIRLDKAIAAARADAGIVEPMPHWTLHDLRRTLVTGMNEALGIAPHVIEAVVNHVSGQSRAGVAGIYNRAVLLPQRRAALDAWAAHVKAITTGEAAASNVEAIRA